MDFRGKTAVITGAAVGIGRAVAIRLAQEGANLVLVDMNFAKLQEVYVELEPYQTEVLIFEGDVSDESRVNEIIAEAQQKFRTIDILVNNAALWRGRGSFLELSIDDWKHYIDVNVMGTVYFIRAVLPNMLANQYGRIINVSSVAGVYGNANMVHYSATKGAINSLTRGLAKEVADKNILVNSVCPGSVSPSDNPDVNYYKESNLSFMGRTGTDMENANLIAFLASDEASYISGQNIQIDGCRKKQ